MMNSFLKSLGLILLLLLVSCTTTQDDSPGFDNLYYFLNDVEAERLHPRDYAHMNDVYELIGYDRTTNRTIYRRRK